MRTGTVEPTLYADNLGDIEPGDLQQGTGISTAQLGRVTVARSDAGRKVGRSSVESDGKSALQNVGEALTGKKDHGGSSLMIFGVFIALAIVVKYVSQKAGDASEFASVRIGLENWLVVGILASTFFYVEKMGAALLPADNAFVNAFREFVGVI